MSSWMIINILTSQVEMTDVPCCRLVSELPNTHGTT